MQVPLIYIDVNSPTEFEACVFRTTTLFVYDDRAGSAGTQYNYADFLVAIAANGWPIVFGNVEFEDEADTYVDFANRIHYLKPTSKAVGLSNAGRYAGYYPIGFSVLATDPGWQNNSGFTLNVDRYETTGVATIETPEISYGNNRILDADYLSFIDDLPNGVAFDIDGNLSAALYSGNTATGLNIPLTENEVYMSSNFAQITTNLRVISLTSLEYFRAQATEVITAIDDNGNAGEIKQVTNYTGKKRLRIKYRKTGELESSVIFKDVFQGEIPYEDANGRTPADPLYDESTREPIVAAFLRAQLLVTDNQNKYI